jgi:hypothetical protein
MPSLFNNLYKYRQSELRHQKENFLTEILAHCLRVDILFRNAFLTKLEIKSNYQNFVCETQFQDRDLGRPDIYIALDQKLDIIIECKIGAIQEKTQLNRYAKLLIKNGAPKKYLIYLTKHFEETGEFSKLKFIYLRWYDIFGLTINSTHVLTIELGNFLIEEKMSTKISFNNKTLNTLKDVQELISSRDEFLNYIKELLAEVTKSKFNKIKRLEFGDYGIECEYLEGKLWVGFCQYEDDEEMQLCIEFISKNDSNLSKKKNLLALANWEYDSIREAWYLKNELSRFFVKDEFDSNSASRFIKDEVERLRSIYSKVK